MKQKNTNKLIWLLLGIVFIIVVIFGIFIHLQQIPTFCEKCRWFDKECEERCICEYQIKTDNNAEYISQKIDLWKSCNTFKEPSDCNRIFDRDFSPCIKFRQKTIYDYGCKELLKHILANHNYCASSDKFGEYIDCGFLDLNPEYKPAHLMKVMEEKGCFDAIS